MADSPSPTNDAPATDAAPSPLRSVHTTNFPAILDELGSSLLVTTYQAGKLVLLRSDGGVINTHFRAFNKPMGLAVGRGRLAVGTAVDVWEFRNVPAVTIKLEPRGKHDACYLPRSAHVTGDVQIHEMAYVGDELWFVNTRFEEHRVEFHNQNVKLAGSLLFAKKLSSTFAVFRRPNTGK